MAIVEVAKVARLVLLGELEPDVLLVDRGPHREVRAGTPARPKHKARRKLRAAGWTKDLTLLLLLLRGERLEAGRVEALRQRAALMACLVGVLRDLALFDDWDSLAILHVFHHGAEVRGVAHGSAMGRCAERGGLTVTRGRLRSGARERGSSRLKYGSVRGQRRHRGERLGVYLGVRRGGGLEIRDNALEGRERVAALARCRRDRRRLLGPVVTDLAAISLCGGLALLVSSALLSSTAGL